MNQLTLAEMIPLIQFDVGVVAIGFTAFDEAELNQIDDSSGTNMHIVRHWSNKSHAGGFIERLIPHRWRLAAVSEYMATLRYEHSEVALFLSHAGQSRFGSEKMLGIGCGIEDGVFTRERSYHPGYAWIYVKANAESIEAILKFAVQQRGRPFDSGGMSRIATAPGQDHRSSYFCAKLTLACLEHLPLPDFHLNPCNKLTNDDIYEIVSRPQNSTTTPQRIVPAQMKQIFPAMADQSLQKQTASRRI